MAGENGIDKGLSLAKFLKFQIRRKSLVRKPAGNDLQSFPFSFPWSIIARILSQRKKFPFVANQNSFVLETSSAPFRSLWPNAANYRGDSSESGGGKEGSMSEPVPTGISGKTASIRGGGAQLALEQA